MRGVSMTVLALLGCCGAAAAALPELLLEVSLNGVDTGDTRPLLRAADGRLLALASDLQRWRLRLPSVAPLLQDGQAYHRLDDLDGLSYQLDENRQAVALRADAGRFDATRLDLATGYAAPTPAAPAAFLNYELSSTRADRAWQNGALLELGASGRLGTGVGSVALYDGVAGLPRVLRLETAWTRDFPERQASLRMGDAISRAGQWGRSVRFGGVQWATNFATQPGLVTFALPTLAGEAVLPSTVDLYVNDVLQQRREIPAGPFSLQQLPVISGQGETRMVVRDLLGREQVVVAPYYASPRLLRAGLHDYSYEAGRIREDFGRVGNRYGRTALVATHRLGLDDALTVEAHGEWVGSQQSAGLGAVAAWAGVGTVHASVAASRGEGGGGTLMAFGAEHQSRRFSAGGNAQFASAGFTQIGQQPGQRAVRQNLQLYAGVPLGGGSLSLGYLLQSPRDRDPVRLLSLGYNVSLGSLGHLGVSLLRSAGPQGRTVANITFTRTLDERVAAYANGTVQHGQAQGQLQVQQSLPAGEGMGWRVLASEGADRRLEGGASVQHAGGTASLDLALSQGRPALRLGASGGLAWLDGGLFASRRIDGSFAVVQVPGLPGVGVYADNQLVARTDADGRALLPRLRPYQRNPVRIEPADLPLETQIDSTEMDAVPAYRSGTVLRFPVRRSRGATLRVTFDGAVPVPAGAVARVAGQSRDYPFGLEGQLYLGGLGAADRVEVDWPGHRCAFDLALPAAGEALPDLGDVACHRAAP